MAPSDSDNRDRRRRSPRSQTLQSDDRDRRRDDRSREPYRKPDNDDSHHRRSSRSPRERRREDRDELRHPRMDRSNSIDNDRRRRHRRRDDRERDSHRRNPRERDDDHNDRDRPSRRRRDEHHRSRSPDPKRRRRSVEKDSRSHSPRAPVRSRGALPSQNDAFQSTEVTKIDGSPAPEKEKPNFGNTGRLAAESNTVSVNGGSVVLKYHEPPEARKPPGKDGWRLYVFKGEDLLEVVPLGERSCWLVGREKLVVDFPIEHPSCSKQHAAIQFRYVEKRNEFGDKLGRVRPYLIDLESANGSMVNGDLAPGGRYVELRDKDVLKFGHSSREYVLMLAAE